MFWVFAGSLFVVRGRPAFKLYADGQKFDLRVSGHCVHQCGYRETMSMQAILESLTRLSTKAGVPTQRSIVEQ